MGMVVDSISYHKIGSPPDVDTDFPEAVRDAIYYDYLVGEWGRENVAHVTTLGTIQAKKAINAAAKNYRISVAEATAAKKLLPDKMEGTLADLLASNSEVSAQFDRLKERNPRWEDALKAAVQLEGHVNQYGVHAGAVIISNDSLVNHSPVRWNRQGERMDMVLQYTYQECEALGLIKYDFLGLDTLGILQDAVRYVLDSNDGEGPNLVALAEGDMDDERVYREIFQPAHTIGVFQFGTSDTMRELLRMIQPTSFGDLAAATALGRPGPMEMGSHIMYADRKNGRAPIEPIHKDFVGSPLEDILGPTFGLPVYQEQAMRAARALSGFSARDADVLRKAMGKKKADVMESLRVKFIDGGISNGYIREAMSALWEYLAAFSGYSFNYSHSVAYTINSYQCAWMKCHYPVEFMSALLHSALKTGSKKSADKDKLRIYLAECKRMGIRVLAPDVNKASVTVTPDAANRTIYYGLADVGNVGVDEAEAIIRERENGVFTGDDLDQTMLRVRACGVRSRAAVALASVGGFDSVRPNRGAVLAAVESAWSASRRTVDNAAAFGGGGDLFSAFMPGEVPDPYADIADVSFIDRLRGEYEFMNTFVSGFPTDRVGDGFATPGALERRSGRWFDALFTVTNMVEKGSKDSKYMLYTISDGVSTLAVRESDAMKRQARKLEMMLGFRESFKAGGPQGFVRSLDHTDRLILADMLVVPMPRLEIGRVYWGRFNVVRGWGDNAEPRVVLSSYDEVPLSANGSYAHRLVTVRGESSVPSPLPSGGGHDLWTASVVRGPRAVNTVAGVSFRDLSGGDAMFELLYSALFACGFEAARVLSECGQLEAAPVKRPVSVRVPRDMQVPSVAESFSSSSARVLREGLGVVPVSSLMVPVGASIPDLPSDDFLAGFERSAFDRGKYSRKQ